MLKTGGEMGLELSSERRSCGDLAARRCSGRAWCL